tara:strand:+ start:5936 stop:7573 length:1638 start_codon:yes stop_codon:yes gene_type:complete
MKILEKVNIDLIKILESYEIFENIDIKISKLNDYDYQINNLVKFQSHKEVLKIKKEFSNALDNSKFVEDFEITNDLFINIRINLEDCVKFFKNIQSDIKIKNPKKIIIDYGGPNIGKPLHVGHLRSLNIGRSLQNLNKIVGNQVTTDIHLGDWGMPVAQIIAYCENFEIDINSLTVDELIEIYPKSSALYSESDEFKTLAQEKNKNLNSGEKNTLSQWNHLREISLVNLKETLSILNHDFDYWLGESDVNHLIEPMIKSLIKENKVTSDDGALVSSEHTDPKILIAKSDGSYLYLTTDIATIENRLKKNNFDIALYVVDSRQKLHFEQLFRTVEYFDFPKREYIHVGFGTINDEKGNPFKTRDGGTKELLSLYSDTFNYIKNINKDLDENIISKLTNTVLTYSDLLTNRKTDYKFNIEKFTNISGKTGIYVQYAQVRAKKILEKSNVKIVNKSISLINEAERNLAVGLLNLEIFIKQSVTLNEPHHLADYLYEICNLFNIFYKDENILNIEDSNLKMTKLLLTKYFLNHVTIIMNALGIEPVDEM